MHVNKRKERGEGEMRGRDDRGEGRVPIIPTCFCPTTA